jgi:bifunctional non-homologous end joining protein LigD
MEGDKPIGDDRAADERIGRVRITHPDRLIDPEGETRKGDLVHYWAWIVPRLLPDVAGRPVTLLRAPDDITGKLFYQKHADRREIPFVKQHVAPDADQRPLLLIDNPDALLGAAQMGTIELHTWNAHVSNLERPDRLVFDLDPDPALPWAAMIEAAQLVRGMLDVLGLTSFCKTSGGRGLHIVVPIARYATWTEGMDFSRALAHKLADEWPDRFTATAGAPHRHGKILVDYLRNARGATTIAAYSPRARPRLGVSVPIGLNELPETWGGAQWTINTLGERLDRLVRDPWKGYADERQRLTTAMRARLESP